MESEPRVALITAGTAGLGAATAHLFARNGIRVVVNYHSDATRAWNLVDELRRVSPLAKSADGVDYVAAPADMSRREAIVQLVDYTVATIGRLHIVFSNAGWTCLRDINALDDNVVEDDW